MRRLASRLTRCNCGTGCVHEPMTDLFAIFSKLVTPQGEILVPGIKDLVAPLTPEERKRYEVMEFSLSVRPLYNLSALADIGDGSHRTLKVQPNQRLAFQKTKQKSSWLACATHRSPSTESRTPFLAQVARLSSPLAFMANFRSDSFLI